MGNAVHKRKGDNLVGGSQGRLHKVVKTSPKLNLKGE